MFWPSKIDGFAGVMAIEDRAPATTVAVAGVAGLIPFWVQEMLTEPSGALLSAVASPLLLIVTAAGFEEVQAQLLVMSVVRPSLKVPTALNCLDEPRGTLAVAGLIAMELKTALSGAAPPPPQPIGRLRRSDTQATTLR